MTITAAAAGLGAATFTAVDGFRPHLPDKFVELEPAYDKLNLPSREFILSRLAASSSSGSSSGSNNGNVNNPTRGGSDSTSQPTGGSHQRNPNSAAALIERAEAAALKPLPPAEDPYDVIVIGGGATGLGVALDAVTRGLKTALVERGDFASGTSGRSTKLIHGGVRYLEKAFLELDRGQLELVHEALFERETLLAVGGHLSHMSPIMVPIYEWWRGPYVWAGSKVYDFISGTPYRSRWVKKADVKAAMPNIEDKGLKGAVVFYDGQHNDARMALSLALSAVHHGADLLTYARADALLKDSETGQVTGVKVVDELTGKEMDVRGRVVVNATGPFADKIRLMDDPNAHPIVVPSIGVHVVLPRNAGPDGSVIAPRRRKPRNSQDKLHLRAVHEEDLGLMIPETKDGRVLFMLPWQGAVVAGTTDGPSPVVWRPSAPEEAVQWVENELNTLLKENATDSDIMSTWAGFRPLVADPEKAKAAAEAGKELSTADLARVHVLMESDSGLVTIASGKWTIYRRMAQDTIDLIVNKYADIGAKATPCVTHEMLLYGAEAFDEDSSLYVLRRDMSLSPERAFHLTQTYGDLAVKVAEFTDEHPEWNKELIPGHMWTESEVVWAVRHEYATRAEDMLARRTRAAFLDVDGARAAMPRVVALMAKELGWNDARSAAELKSCENLLKTFNRSGTKKGEVIPDE